MKTASAPQWDLLPRDPHAFFGLEKGFDRKDLKRAYGKLIRVYKPETHPDEFQRIRRAYEELELEQRYGAQQQTEAAQADAWNQASVTARKASEEGQDRKPTSVTEMAVSDPVGTYQKLGASNRRSPQDCYVMAILADVVGKDDPNGFIKWLLTGVKHNPDDPGMIALLKEYFSAEVSVAQAPSLLTSLSKLVPSHVFFRISERLWKRLIDEMPFGNVAQLLDRCEANLRPGPLPATIAFYLQMLKPALFKGTAPWVNSTIAKIEQTGSQLDEALESELEFLRAVWSYCQEDRETLSRSSLGGLIDSMIEAYCTLPWREATQRIIQVQDQVARDSHGVMDTFAAEPNPCNNRVVYITGVIAADIAEQMGLEYRQVADRGLERLADNVLVDVENDIPPLVGKIQRTKQFSYVLPFLALFLSPLLIASIFLSVGELFGIGILWLPFAGFITWALIEYVFDKRIERRIEALIAVEYLKRWRPRILRYIQSCNAHPHEALFQLHRSAEEFGDSLLIGVVYSFASEDAAFPIFGRAQLFLQ